MGKSLFVSVIVPTYNREATLGRTIDSVLAQTYTHFELIVVDDGSTDNTRSVVASYTDDRIRYIKTSNQKLPAARNEGIRLATGEYLVFCDSDDTLNPDYLTFFVEKATQHPDCGMLYANAFWEKFDQDIIPMMPDEIPYVSGVSTCTWFVKRAPYVWFNPYVTVSEDWYFLQYLRRHCTLKYFDYSVARVGNDGDGKITTEQSVTKAYQDVSRTIMKDFCHHRPQFLVVIKCVTDNVNLIFLTLNHLRLFFPSRFELVFDCSLCPDKAKQSYIRACGYLCFSDRKVLKKWISSYPVASIFESFEFVLPQKGVEPPEKIVPNTQYFPTLFKITNPKKVRFFTTYWIPSPLIIESYDGGGADQIKNDGTFFCDKKTYLSEKYKMKESIMVDCLAIPHTIQSMFLSNDHEGIFSER
ncbi:hypothetical protein DID77_00070 [Candidatus Marinamargulisbacteria bacterium SCGC AG-439-L15]|nr:hypothetical protein DID77_00070 [Candidatus Marinamargulisbacteria bacterium SCGC AG-439-L15]